MKRVAVVNLGCEKNLVDGEVLAGFLGSRYRVVKDVAKAEIIVVNTCTFIETAREESIDVLFEMLEYKDHRRGLAEKVIAAGCLAQRYNEELLRELPEVDGVFGSGDLAEILTFIDSLDSERRTTHKLSPDFLYDHTMPRLRTSPPYLGYIKIADGCNNNCSYCVLPSVRGSFRSRRPDSVLAEVRQMAREGVKELIFLAQDTTLYGIDLGGKLLLPDLLRQCAAIEGIAWIRLMYCYPQRVTDDLIAAIRDESKMCRYLDLPLQHAADPVLRAMNRRYTQREVRELIAKVRSEIPGIVLRTTLMTGFPGESSEDFAELKNFVKDMAFDHLGVFAYSQEEETPAGSRKDQIPTEVREARREELMRLQAELLEQSRPRRIGRLVRVLLEEEAGEYWVGRTEGDAPEIDGRIYMKGQNRDYYPGRMVTARLIEIDGYDYKGEEVDVDEFAE